MNNNYWLDLSFNLIEDYIPKGVIPYNESRHIRTKFEQISDHAVTVAKFFQLNRNSRIFSTHMDRKYIDEFEKYKAYPCIAQ
jgi:hypothetical protein